MSEPVDATIGVELFALTGNGQCGLEIRVVFGGELIETSIADSGLGDLRRTVFNLVFHSGLFSGTVAFGMGLMPVPGALNDGLEVGEFRFPLQFPFDPL